MISGVMAQRTPQSTPQPNVSEVALSPRLWVAVVLTGAGAGLAGGLLMRLLRVVQHVSYSYAQGDFLDGVAAASGGRRVGVMLLAGIVAAGALAVIPRIWGKTSGGLSEAIWRRSGLVAAGPTLAHALLSIVTVGMGVALGREGALKDTGAVAGNWLADWVGLRPEQRQLLAACGAGAGMAAAYNVPLGGALFAAEVLLGSLSLSAILPALVASFTAVTVSWVLLPNEAAYRIPELRVSGALLVWALLAAPVMGLLSVVCAGDRLGRDA